MSLIYNRDRNIQLDSTLTSFDFNPSYGSTIRFNCKKNIMPYKDFTYSMMPSTLNNIIGECNFAFVKERETAQKIMNFFESQSGTGAFAIQDNSDIYRVLTGYADEYSISMENNNLYNINLKFNVERNSSMLQWQSMSFVNHTFVEWETGQYYQKYQPVYYPLYTDKTKNFFYALKDHTSASGDFPFNTSGIWTQSLFYENEFQLSVQTKPKVEINYFQNAFNQRIKTQQNINYFENLQLEYRNISDFKLKSMLHFLENSLGYKKFEFDLPQIYNKRKIFYVDSWQHTWKYKDSNDLVVSLVEDPLGLIDKTDAIPKEIIVGQLITGANTPIGITGLAGSEFILQYSGVKTFATGFSSNINWGSANPRNVNITYPISGLSVGTLNNQVYAIYFGENTSILNADCKVYGDVSFYATRNIDNISFDGSNLKNLRLPDQTGIKNISAQTSTIETVDLYQVQNLTGLNLGNSPLTSGSLTNCLKNLNAQKNFSGYFVATGATNHLSSDLQYITGLDYKAWSLRLKSFDVSLENLKSYFSNNIKAYWFQTQAPTLYNNLTWTPNTGSNNFILNQQFTEQSDTWFYPELSTSLQNRPAYKFPANCVLTGSGITNINANNLGCFAIANAKSNPNPYYPYGLRCLVNFDATKNYGLFVSGNGFYFIDGSNNYLLSSNIDFDKFYSFGFIRNSTTVTGFLNGTAVGSQSIVSNAASRLDISVGSSTGGNFLNGNLADLLIFGDTSAISLVNSQTGKFFTGYLGRYGANFNL